MTETTIRRNPFLISLFLGLGLALGMAGLAWGLGWEVYIHHRSTFFDSGAIPSWANNMGMEWLAMLATISFFFFLAWFLIHNGFHLPLLIGVGYMQGLNLATAIFMMTLGGVPDYWWIDSATMRNAFNITDVSSVLWIAYMGVALCYELRLQKREEHDERSWRELVEWVNERERNTPKWLRSHFIPKSMFGTPELWDDDARYGVGGDRDWFLVIVDRMEDNRKRWLAK